LLWEFNSQRAVFIFVVKMTEGAIMMEGKRGQQKVEQEIGGKTGDMISPDISL
jgi:hypothetical protein